MCAQDLYRFGIAYFKSLWTEEDVYKRQVFGGIVLIFAVIGVIATVLFLSRTAVQLAGNNREKDTYEWLITPVVLQDPPTFESPDKLIDSTIITAGVWRLIMNEDTDVYKRQGRGDAAGAGAEWTARRLRAVCHLYKSC